MFEKKMKKNQIHSPVFCIYKKFDRLTTPKKLTSSRKNITTKVSEENNFLTEEWKMHKKPVKRSLFGSDLDASTSNLANMLPKDEHNIMDESKAGLNIYKMFHFRSRTWLSCIFL